MATARVRRGRKTQEVVAEWFCAHGWLDAKSRPASLPGSDVYDVPGYSIEVKATSTLDIGGALKQAEANRAHVGDLPFVVSRRNGQGENAGDYVVLMRLSYFTELMDHAETREVDHGHQ